MIHRTISAFGGSLLLLSIPNASAALILADTADGDINAGTTWAGDAAPIVGDMNQWGTSTFTVKTGTQTWEGQELILQTGGTLGTNAVGPTLTMNGDLTLDGGRITVLNNSAFKIAGAVGQTLTLNSGTLDSGNVNNGRDIVFSGFSLAGSGTINIEGTTASVAADRSAVIFQNSVTTTGFTGLFDVSQKANFFLPTISIANASFGIDVNGSGQIGLTNDYAVTSAVFDGLVIGPGTYTRGELIALGVSSNRVLAAGADSSLTVIPEPSAALLCGLGAFALLRRRRA